MFRKLILIAFLSTACTRVHSGGPKNFLLPWLDMSGHYSLQEVNLSTLPSPYVLKGDAAEVYFQSPFGPDGYTGSIARPHLMESGDLYIPKDAESSQALAVYAELEQLYRFEQKLGTAAQISWPRRIGVDLQILGDSQLTTNNAAFYGSLDVVGLLPFTLASVPLAVNHGVVAHEHFHVHFQSQVIAAMNHDASSTVTLRENPLFTALNFLPKLPSAGHLPSANTEQDATSPKQLNNVVLRAWNEGLADLFAAMFTHQADFFLPSLPDLSPRRTLGANGVGLRMLKGEEIGQVVVNALASGQRPPDMLGLAYLQGTAMARVLYALQQSGPESEEEFARRILVSLPKIPRYFDATFESSLMDVEAVLPVMLEGFPLNGRACAVLSAEVSAELMKASFSACAGS